MKEETVAELSVAGFEKVTIPLVSGRIDENIKFLDAEIAQINKAKEEKKIRLMELSRSNAPKLIYEKYRVGTPRLWEKPQ